MSLARRDTNHQDSALQLHKWATISFFYSFAEVEILKLYQNQQTLLSIVSVLKNGSLMVRF